jgi:hypothetical protein
MIFSTYIGGSKVRTHVIPSLSFKCTPRAISINLHHGLSIRFHVEMHGLRGLVQCRTTTSTHIDCFSSKLTFGYGRMSLISMQFHKIWAFRNI